MNGTNGTHGTNGEPALALSVRQPWAWLIVEGLKNIENRSWSTKFRGLIWVHASKGMTPDEFEACRAFVGRIAPALQFPMWETLESERGGIVGAVEIVGCTRVSTSPWFVGEWGFVLQRARRVPFLRCRGEPGFFKPTFEPQLI